MKRAGRAVARARRTPGTAAALARRSARDTRLPSTRALPAPRSPSHPTSPRPASLRSPRGDGCVGGGAGSEHRRARCAPAVATPASRRRRAPDGRARARRECGRGHEPAESGRGHEPAESGRGHEPADSGSGRDPPRWRRSAPSRSARHGRAAVVWRCAMRVSSGASDRAGGLVLCGLCRTERVPSRARRPLVATRTPTRHEPQNNAATAQGVCAGRR